MKLQEGRPGSTRSGLGGSSSRAGEPPFLWLGGHVVRLTLESETLDTQTGDEVTAVGQNRCQQPGLGWSSGAEELKEPSPRDISNLSHGVLLLGWV